MKMAFQKNYASYTFKYKSILFEVRRSSEGFGWYYASAEMPDRTVVERDTTVHGVSEGDCIGYRKEDVIKAVKRTADAGGFKIMHGQKYRQFER